MTLLEVVMALTIFLIGIVFLIKADQVVHNYRKASEQRQQMAYAADGQLQKYLDAGNTDPYVTIGTQSYSIQCINNPTPLSPNLMNPPQLVTVTIILTPTGSSAQDPFTLKAYRVIP